MAIRFGRILMARTPGTVIPNADSFQDMPPPGGYPKVHAERVFRARGPSGLVIWLSVIGMTIYGIDKVGETFPKIIDRNTENRLNHKEKRETRMAVASYLMYEHDKAILPEISRIENLQKEFGVYRPPTNPQTWRGPHPELWSDLYSNTAPRPEEN